MTWLELVETISFRLNRDDLPDAFVRQMLSERVDFYGPQVLAPSEQTTYFTTLPSQQFYRLPRGTVAVRFVRALVGNNWIPIPKADSYIDILRVDPVQPPFTSPPLSLHRVYGNDIRLFPAPNGNYPIELTMTGTITEPTDDNDETNPWVTDLRILLINATCGEICRERLDIAMPNSPRIAMFNANTAEALEKLMMTAHARTQPSLMKQYL